MIQNRPQYRIKYPQCAQPNHNGEKLNFVCLQKHCRQSALICTLCRQSLHQGHSIKPLKFYFEDLRKQYQSNEIDYPSQLAQLEKNKNIFLYQLRETVERIAKQFEKLQIEILQRFDMVRNQILENQSRKNQFSTFYHNLTHKAEEDPQILMKNYLPHQEIQEIRNTNIVTKLADKLCSQLIKTRQSLFLSSPKEQFGFLSKLSDQQLYIKPANILKQGYIFTQTDANTNPPSLVLLNIPVKQLLQQKSSIKIKVLQLRKGSKLTLGLISKKMFLDLKFIWNNQKQNETMWIFNNGGSHAVQSSNLAVINEGLNIDLTLVNQQFKMSSKKAAACFKLNKNHQWYFFFSLIGKARLEVSF